MSTELPPPNPDQIVSQEVLTTDFIPTFEHYENSRKIVSDETALGIMDDSLEVVPGERKKLKGFLDNIPADKNDVEFAQNPDRIVLFRNQISDFIASNLKISFNRHVVDGAGGKLLADKKRKFLEKIETDKQKVGSWIRSWHGGERPKIPISAYEFRGLMAETVEGDKDLLEDSVEGVRANIRIQREVSDIFVHCSSDSYVHERLSGQNPEMTRRIYLNPKIENSVQIFEKVIAGANSAGIIMKGKILDRSAEALSIDNKQGIGNYGVRGDGIVLVAGTHANELLGMVEAIYRDNPDAFEDRKVSRIPYEIGAGVGIGDEPETGAEFSLTSHRAEVLERAASEARAEIVGSNFSDNEKIQVFRTKFQQTAIKAGINPDNLAFNLRVAA